MTYKNLVPATVFISYSWTTPEHQDWVTSLATRLMQDGVEVKFDKWELKEGHNKYIFMETMVTSEEIDKVLIVVDKEYAKRADERKGGVGTETLIITPKVYENVKQEKFIPLVREINDEGKAYLPAYLDGRIYIDFCNQEQFETSYERLLRNIYNRPEHSKPKKGQPPGYLTEETPMHFRTTTMVRALDVQVDKHPSRVERSFGEFLEEYIGNLMDFVVPEETEKTIEAVGARVLDIFS
ncbi:SEFIR domain-containing protein [Chitinophaga barathri]|uniref:TIR domain-containing protein n=1 Tax=Chitinophaga barathri TaxID=1647451 RepID=A0A3N4MDV2_9BACT|nr:SEFIR domain-containing protein [Chitinophaga barathri]RPD41535.1 TIR domain-containing protein [Chitinophaga barathri]